MAISFVGPGSPLSDAGIGSAAQRLSTTAAEIWTVLSVETSGCGYLPDRRPVILFERHFFSRLTRGAYDASYPDISNPSAGGYGAGGAHQYDRLAQALALDEQAALRSASWGIGQVMGDNYTSAGFADVVSMVTAVVASEDAQLGAVASFINATGLGPALTSHDWVRFARGYNGPAYTKNNYDTSLASAYERLSGGTLPDLTVRAAQVYLMYLGFDPGPKDGVPGKRTYDALNAFQKAQGQAPSNVIDAATVAGLAAALAAG